MKEPLHGLQEVTRAAQDFVAGVADLRGKFLTLTDAIRFHQVPPSVLRACLKSCGFPAPRVSEIATIAYCSQQMYDDYKSRLIGFRALLRRVRATQGRVLPAVRGWQEVERGMQRIERVEGVESIKVGALVAVLISLPKDAGQGHTLTIGDYRLRVEITHRKREKSNK
jgi:hypothetical protein